MYGFGGLGLRAFEGVGSGFRALGGSCSGFKALEGLGLGLA